MTNPNVMYAGGAGGDPYMGLLGTIAPQTSGLMQMPALALQAQSAALQPAGGLMQMPMQQMNTQPQFGSSPGTNWSQVAYQMAGSPNQNPFKGSVLPPASAAGGTTSPAGGGATALGGTALGILGALGKAAGSNTPLGNAISGLMGNNGNPFGTYTTGNIANVGNVPGNSITNQYAPGTAQYTSGLMSNAATQAGTSGIAPVGTDLIDDAADAGINAAIPGLEAATDDENPFGTYTTGNIANVGDVAGNSIASAGASAAAPYTTGLLSDAANAAGVTGIAPVGTDLINDAANADDAEAAQALAGNGGTSLGAAAGAGGDALGIINGLDSGSAAGYAGAAIDAGKLAQTTGLLGSDAAPALGGASGLLGLYSGIEQGGVAGDTQAALSAAQAGGQIATAAGSSLAPALSAAGPLALALAPAIIGMSTPAVSLTPKYWDGVTNSLQSAISSGNKGQIASVVNGILAQPQSQIPQNIQQLVYSTGLVPSMGWGQQYVPNQFGIADQILQQAGGKGGSTGNISVDRK